MHDRKIFSKKLTYITNGHFVQMNISEIWIKFYVFGFWILHNKKKCYL